MQTKPKTVRFPVAVADRLRRAAFRKSIAQNDLVIAAVEHWLTHPYRPGCPYEKDAERYIQIMEERHREEAHL